MGSVFDAFLLPNQRSQHPSQARKTLKQWKSSIFPGKLFQWQINLTINPSANYTVQPLERIWSCILMHIQIGSCRVKGRGPSAWPTPSLRGMRHGAGKGGIGSSGRFLGCWGSRDGSCWIPPLQSAAVLWDAADGDKIQLKARNPPQQGQCQPRDLPWEKIH